MSGVILSLRKTSGLNGRWVMRLHTPVHMFVRCIISCPERPPHARRKSNRLMKLLIEGRLVYVNNIANENMCAQMIWHTANAHHQHIIRQHASHLLL